MLLSQLRGQQCGALSCPGRHPLPRTQFPWEQGLPAHRLWSPLSACGFCCAGRTSEVHLKRPSQRENAGVPFLSRSYKTALTCLMPGQLMMGSAVPPGWTHEPAHKHQGPCRERDAVVRVWGSAAIRAAGDGGPSAPSGPWGTLASAGPGREPLLEHKLAEAWAGPPAVPRLNPGSVCPAGGTGATICSQTSSSRRRATRRELPSSPRPPWRTTRPSSSGRATVRPRRREGAAGRAPRRGSRRPAGPRAWA